ncbi:Uncharacterised protein [Pantoea agglomerans]|uniref:Uncharacterized protein n=1 Tax=Enterobacter agglomerans TaxID=549 RepID=A0A379AFC1_ENTAG|nr:Uncharacterised protein [Pantoea agglomerans]
MSDAIHQSRRPQGEWQISAASLPPPHSHKHSAGGDSGAACNSVFA